MNRKIVFGSLLACFLMLTIPLVPAVEYHRTNTFENIIYVDDDNTDGPWDGTQEHPYMAIQDAVETANDGDTIYVYSGTYYENLIVDKTIELAGENKVTTIIDGGRLNDVIYVSSSVNIHGFTIQNSGDVNERGHYDFGIEIDINSGFANISDNIISDNNGLAGMSIGGGNNHIIYDNIITSNDLYGVVLGNSDNNIVSGNIISDNTFAGLGIMYSNSNHVFDNTILNHGSIDGKTAGFGLMAVFSSGNLFSGNNFSDNFPFGLYLYSTPDSHNTINQNNFIWSLAGFGTVLMPGSYVSVDGKNALSTLPTDSCDVMNRIRCMSSRAAPLNFMKRIQHIPFTNGYISGCTWDENYWYQWDGTRPVIVYGALSLSMKIPIPIPWINFDWHPAKEPYEI